MPVYVDPVMSWPPNPPKWKYDHVSHLIGDTVEELLEFAVNRLGLKKNWFQCDGSLPHFDLTRNMRAKAIAAGAIPLETKDFCEKMRYIRKEYKR